MGLGDMFSGLFGGSNSYKNVNSPIMGPGPAPGQSPEDYQKQQYDAYQKQMGGYQNQITGAQNMGLPQNQLDFSGSKGAMSGLGGIADAMAAMGRGEGPNPALEQLKQTTNQNIANQAAQVASARGMNPALAARMAGNQGAATNQQAAGQAALQAAQQQIAAQQGAGSLYGTMANLGNQQAIAQGQTGLGLLGQQTGRMGQFMQDRLGQQNLLQNAYNSMNNINSGVAAQNAQTAGQYGMGLMGGISGGLGALLHEGGEVPNPDSFLQAIKAKGLKRMASGGEMMAQGMASLGGKLGGKLHDFLSNQFGSRITGMPGVDAAPSIANGLNTGPFDLSQGPKPVFSLGGAPPLTGNDALQAQGVDLTQDPNAYMRENPDFLRMLNQERGLGGLPPMPGASDGGAVPGKPRVGGDSVKNDTVPTLLSPGEIVIPRTATEDPEEAHAFLDKILKQKKRVTGYGDVLKAQRLWFGGCAGGK